MGKIFFAGGLYRRGGLERHCAARIISPQRDRAMNAFLYSASRTIGRLLFFCTIRLHLLRPELASRPGGYILALTHLGNLDPFCSCILVPRPIRWMTRKEFFINRYTAWLLPRLGCFSVNR